MKLWEINQAILDVIDTETGEILDEEKLEQLHMDRKTKLYNIAKLCLNCESDIAELKAQEAKFKSWRVAKEKTVAWCKMTLERELNGETLNSNEFKLSYNPASVEIEDVTAIPKIYMVLPPPKAVEEQPDKRAIKDALAAGKEIPGAKLVRHIKIK